MTMTEKRTAAAQRLVNKLSEIVGLVSRAGHGDQKAMRLLDDHVDGHWHKLVIGDDDLDALLPGGDDDE